MTVGEILLYWFIVIRLAVDIWFNWFIKGYFRLIFGDRFIYKAFNLKGL